MSSLYIVRESTDALIHWTLQLRSPALHVPTTDHLISPNETTNPMWHTHLIRQTESSTVGSVLSSTAVPITIEIAIVPMGQKSLMTTWGNN